jgi:hypothetical protein
MTRSPCANASGTSARDTSCGVARNSNSTPCCFIAGHESECSGYPPLPERTGNTSAKSVAPPDAPLSADRRSSAGFSSLGCRRRIRVSSRPEYPVAPSTAVLSFADIFRKLRFVNSDSQIAVASPAFPQSAPPAFARHPYPDKQSKSCHRPQLSRPPRSSPPRPERLPPAVRCPQSS